MASLPASSSTPSLAVTQRPYQQPQSNTLSSSGPKPAQSGSASAPADPFFAPLERAAASIRDCLALDARWPDLADTFVASASADYELQLSAPWAPVEKRRSLIIPEAVFENYDSPNPHTGLGLFTEIERAWITINNRLYLWNYLEGSNTAFESYEHPDSIITSVGLVRPKPGVFIDSISWVLVLCTPSNVTLLGLAFEKPNAAPGAAGPSNDQLELRLYVTDLTIQTDGVTMSGVKGTSSGRLFCHGSDQCLYEIVYQAAEGWFSSKCSLKNLTSPRLGNFVPSFIKGKQEYPIDFVTVDDSRNVLYTLHRSLEIEIWHLPSRDSSVAPVRIARASDICKHAQMLCPGSPSLDPRVFAIVWLGVVSPKESKNVHLVAVTRNGVRLYFSHHRGGVRGFGYRPENAAPTCLELVHVRPPPSPGQPNAQGQGFASQNTSGLPDHPPQHHALNDVRHAAYADGILVAASAHPNVQGIDNLFYATPSVSQHERPAGTGVQRPAGLWETATDVLVEGVTFAIAEVQQPAGGARLNPLATQMTAPPRIFLALTNSGLIVLTQRRPVDVLRALLEVGSGQDQNVIAFFESFGRAQSCAMCLAIASHNTQLTTAPEALLTPAAAKGDGANGALGPPRMLSTEVAAHARRIFFDFGGRPTLVDPGYPTQAGSSGQNDRRYAFSGRHDGMALYLARLVQPFWNEKVTRKVPTRTEPERQVSNLSERMIVNAQRDLNLLQQFLNQNGQLFTLAGPQGLRGNAGAAEDEQAMYRAEQASLNALRTLLSQALEALSFVQLLIDHRLSNIIAACPPALQKQLLDLTYADLLTTRAGRDAARGLVAAVIDAQIGAQMGIDAVADMLQARCGSFCSADDVRLYKAIECIRRAKEARDERERVESLRESARLLGKATTQLPLEKLQEICKEYENMRFATGAIDLPLRCAKDWDPQGQGVAYYADGCPSNDPRSTFYERRKECYRCVLGTLKSLDDLLDETYRGQPDAAKDRTVQGADSLRSNAYAQALESQDALFHVSLYDWLLERQMTDQLLEVRSPFVEDYLRSEPTTLEKCELLWQHYVRNGEYYSAAQVLAGLAQSTEFDLPLSRRVEYLSLAVSNAKSFGTGSYMHDNVAFTTDIEEKLEVAQVQVEVYRAIYEDVELREPKKSELLGIIDEQLLDISTLYREFAEPLAMLEVKLMIFHVSEHRDLELVKETWQALLDEAHANGPRGCRYEGVANAVLELGKRLFPSEVAAPIDLIADMLESYSYTTMETGAAPAGWGPNTMIDAGAPPELVFDVLEGAFQVKREPWNTRTGQAFLLSDIAVLLSIWLSQSVQTSPYDRSSANGNGASLGFPAKRVDDAINAYIVALNAAAGAPDAELPTDRKTQQTLRTLKETQEKIRRRF